jgi:hypothetical protein
MRLAVEEEECGLMKRNQSCSVNKKAETLVGVKKRGQVGRINEK